jgi:DivIVA domain-containing protein
MRRELGGYDPVAVDTFLARCLTHPGLQRSRFPELRGRAPSGERVTAEEIRRVRFRKAVLGYRIRVVDALLEELAEAVERTTWRSRESTIEAVSALRRPAFVGPRATAPSARGTAPRSR